MPVKCARLKHLQVRAIYQASRCSRIHLFATPTMSFAKFLVTDSAVLSASEVQWNFHCGSIWTRVRLHVVKLL